ncbi:unnamed protein product [Penicillium manginii]
MPGIMDRNQNGYGPSIAPEEDDEESRLTKIDYSGYFGNVLVDRRAKTGAAERESNVDANDKFVAVLYLLWWLEGYFNVKDDESLRNEGKNGILFRGGGRSPQVLRIGSLQSDGY